MDPEEVEVVRLRQIDQNFPYPLFLPGQQASLGIREEPVKGNVPASEEDASPVEVEFSPFNGELAHSECCHGSVGDGRAALEPDFHLVEKRIPGGPGADTVDGD